MVLNQTEFYKIFEDSNVPEELQEFAFIYMNNVLLATVANIKTISAVSLNMSASQIMNSLRNVVLHHGILDDMIAKLNERPEEEDY
jgi:hypothetical protein